MTNRTCLILLLCLILVGAVAQAAPPERERQNVYGITPWTGKEYGGTFAPAGVDKIYLLADTDHVLNTLETEVYYWPITKEYMANWFESREIIDGKLKILQDGKEIALLERQPYAHLYPQGFYAGASELITGEDAKRKYEEYQNAVEDYWEMADEFRKTQAQYEREMTDILEEVMETGRTFDEHELPVPPKEPVPPIWYVTGVIESFIVNLPAGEYSIQTIDSSGNLVPDTKKKLKVFEERRTGVAYQIIPESKWTRPEQSNDISQILYLEGERTMYMKAVHASEYNQHDYLRMTSLEKPLAGKGAESAYMWVHLDEVPDAKVQILEGGKIVQEISPKPYFVSQSPGYTLGYDIVDFDPDAPELQGREPSFEAMKLQIGPGSYQIRVVNGDGEVVKGSLREVRSINTVSAWQLYLLSAIPAVIGLIVVLRRRIIRRKLLGTTA